MKFKKMTLRKGGKKYNRLSQKYTNQGNTPIWITKDMISHMNYCTLFIPRPKQLVFQRVPFRQGTDEVKRMFAVAKENFVGLIEKLEEVEGKDILENK